jgi:hypothetical protein
MAPIQLMASGIYVLKNNDTHFFDPEKNRRISIFQHALNNGNSREDSNQQVNAQQSQLMRLADSHLKIQ